MFRLDRISKHFLARDLPKRPVCAFFCAVSLGNLKRSVDKSTAGLYNRNRILIHKSKKEEYMNMRKILAIVLACLMVLPFMVACTQQPATTEAPKAETTVTEAPKAEEKVEE